MATKNMMIRVDPEWWEQLEAYSQHLGMFPARVMQEAAEREMRKAGFLREGHRTLQDIPFKMRRRQPDDRRPTAVTRAPARA